MNWWGFVQDNKGQPSMSRLLCFLAFWPSTYVIIKQHEVNTLSWYLSAYAAAYTGGKLADALMSFKKESNAVSN